MANIEHLQSVNVPAELVYETLTTEKGLSEIWTNELKVNNHIGFINEFRFGENDLTKMRIDELVPDKKIVWQCVDSGDAEWIGTTISFDIEENNGKTSITFRQMNWKDVTTCYRICNYNWAIFLYSLKQYCEEEVGMPYQKRKF
ncbi:MULTISPECIES: SRPBCC domain-containing protein [Oceanobacillus]|uniref:Activator of HSP90 ATPase n=1 Tax=Oceanobacillus kimchii TaxID=746691 RepID=A0ABQ5TPH5_9BACI|nr:MULTISPECIES: SRPBCC domain-containing protein [Oceanobacillus]MBT2600062.1 SRPBCC domain-containing protein [Oceanobacillus sp. ISL-74]MBT2652490.1 SRPBCC domain-containing protein [Oceanobacillus sp. ISL-73]OEH56358.1 ATPase [Oceanobacillus sp. E9]GLO68047.1 activator of HSP90 ATPase [Oceanobacillus kimchii]